MILFPIFRGQIFSNQISLRLFFSQLANKMDNILKPPEEVYLMKDLNRSAFEKVVDVPVLNIRDVKVSTILPLVKKFLLKIENFKAITHENEKSACVYLNPQLIETWADLPEDVRMNLENLKLTEADLKIKDLKLGYEHFNAETVLRAVLPKDKEGVSSFTKVGHIVHVNLREHLISYKNIIGEILYDKIKGCESVVNKVNMIDNTYRNFQMEVLKGTDNMHTTLKENHCKFEFDFSTVYWNSRLCTEHERIVKALNANDVLFDVFAGVGPFSVPAAKKKCIVFANDLNPESYKWLIHNKKINKVSDEYFKGFNLDGREFISKVLKDNLTKYIDHKVVIAMNLPALAVEFLDAYIGLFQNAELPDGFKPITVYVYCFAKGENPEEIARNLIHSNLSIENINIDSKITDIFRVRTVSSMKEMMRVTLSLDRDILVGGNKRKIGDEACSKPDIKKLCVEVDDKNGEEQEEKQQRVQSGGSQEPENESQGQSRKE